MAPRKWIVASPRRGLLKRSRVRLGRCVVKKFAGVASRFMRDEEGATLLEYGMLVLLITVLSIVFVSSIGKKVSNGFSTVDSVLP